MMARGIAKTADLTADVRLEQALVPENEQPYEVPENWCWTRLKTLLSTSKEKTDDFSDASVKYVGLEHIQKDGGIIGFDSAQSVKSLKNVFHSGQILYGKLRPYLNKHAIALFDGVCSTDILVFNASELANPIYANYFFDQRDFIEYAVANSKGINLPRVSEDVVLQAVCPLPPLAEQQRIVDRIETLFAKLDEARDKVQEVVDGFETRKAAILHKAFTGELTAQWRKEHGVGMESWESTNLCKHSSKIGDGLHGTPVFSEMGGYYFINGNNFSGSTIEIKTDTKKVDFNEFEKYKLDLSTKTVFVSINGTLGRTAFYNDEPIILGKSACYVNVKDSLDKHFLRFFFCTKEFIDYANKKATGSTIKNLGLKAMRDLPLKLPTLVEQKEITRILNVLVTKEERAKETAETVLEEIDLIKKSILARAFRGELGTNDPSEESAVELLKTVL